MGICFDQFMMSDLGWKRGSGAEKETHLGDLSKYKPACRSFAVCQRQCFNRDW